MSLTIVVGFDDSAPSHAALDTAVKLAKEASGRVILACGLHPRGAAFEHPRIGGGEIEAAEEACDAAMIEAVKTRAATGVTIETVISRDDSTRALTATADEYQADLIVVGSRGEGALTGLMLGSTAYRLLHHSSHPVLVVPGK